MSVDKTIARNTAWLMLATLAQKVIAFLVFFYIARKVGPTITGKYFYAVSITSIFVIFADLGLTPVVIREMASHEKTGRAVLAQALRVKFALIPLAIVSALAYAYFVHVELDVFLAILIACLVMSCDAVSLVWYGVIRGKRDLRFEAIGMLIGQVCTAILAITAVELSWGAAGLVFALLCGSAWNVGWSMWRAWKLGLWPNGRDSWSLRRLIPAALPFALAGLFVKVYSFIDSLLLRHYDGFATVGQYAVANKLTYAFQFLPLTFAAALYPAMSSAHAEKDRASLERTLYGSLRLMMLVSIPLAAVISALSSTIILTFYKTTYSEAIIPLSILVWVLPALFLDFPVGSLLNATRRSFKKTIAMGITMVVNVGLNVWLIPRFGMLGASFTALISFWLLLAVGLWFVRHDLASQAWKTILLFVRGAGAALVIWYIVQAVTGDMPFVMALLFSGAVSVLALFLFRLLLVKDVMFCIRWLLRRPVEPPSEAEEEAGTHV